MTSEVSVCDTAVMYLNPDIISCLLDVGLPVEEVRHGPAPLRLDVGILGEPLQGVLHQLAAILQTKRRGSPVSQRQSQDFNVPISAHGGAVYNDKISVHIEFCFQCRLQRQGLSVY